MQDKKDSKSEPDQKKHKKGKRRRKKKSTAGWSNKIEHEIHKIS